MVQALFDLGKHYRRWVRDLDHSSEESKLSAFFCEQNLGLHDGWMVLCWFELFEADPMASAVLVHWGAHVLSKIDAVLGASNGGSSQIAGAADEHLPAPSAAGGGAAAGGAALAGGGMRGAARTEACRVKLTLRETWYLRSLQELRDSIKRLEAERGVDGKVDGMREWCIRGRAREYAWEVYASILSRRSAARSEQEGGGSVGGGGPSQGESGRGGSTVGGGIRRGGVGRSSVQDMDNRPGSDGEDSDEEEDDEDGISDVTEDMEGGGDGHGSRGLPGAA